MSCWFLMSSWLMLMLVLQILPGEAKPIHRIGMLTIFSTIQHGWEHKFLSNKVAYAHQHDYKLALYGHLNSSFHPAWSKILATREILDKYEYLWSIDLDAVIMNMSISVESLIEDGSDLIVATDCNGINTGSIIWRNTPWTHNFLTTVLQVAYNDSIPVPEGSVGRYDQRGIIHALYADTENLQHAKIVSARKMNAWPRMETQSVKSWCPDQDYEPGDFVVHFPGPLKKDIPQFISRYHIPQ